MVVARLDTRLSFHVSSHDSVDKVNAIREMDESEDVDDPEPSEVESTVEGDQFVLGDDPQIVSIDENGILTLLGPLSSFVAESIVAGNAELLTDTQSQLVSADEQVLTVEITKDISSLIHDSQGLEIAEVTSDELKKYNEGRKKEKVKKKLRTYICSEPGCNRSYTSLHHLKVHTRNHRGVRPYVCSYGGCKKAFSSVYGCKAHLRTHTGEKPYFCTAHDCDKAFKTSGDLQKHTRTHTGERPFKCPYEGCDKAFTTSNIRKVHIRSHTGERPFVCEVADCGRKFASSTNHKNHMRIHSGEKPYSCPVDGCEKRFTEYSSFYKHQAVHNQRVKYSCVYCSKSYRQFSSLLVHKKTVHRVGPDPPDASPPHQPNILEMKKLSSTDNCTLFTVEEEEMDDEPLYLLNTEYCVQEIGLNDSDYEVSELKYGI